MAYVRMPFEKYKTQYIFNGQTGCQPIPIPQPQIEPPKVVTIPLSVYKAQKGNYFIGQSGIFQLASTGSTLDGIAMVALVNPSNSNKNIYINSVVFSNYSNNPIKSVFYFEGNLPQPGTLSASVRCSNSSIIPTPIPFGEIQVLNPTSTIPIGGFDITARSIAPYGVVEIDFEGRLILAPGKSFIAWITGPVQSEVSMSFGWWEELIT